MQPIALRWNPAIGVIHDVVRLARGLRGEVREMLTRRLTWRKYADDFAARSDPWKYETTPFTLEKIQAAVEMLARARDGNLFARAWEIGCAEGFMTARLAPMCAQLYAVDFIPLALARARERCEEFSNVSFIEWNIEKDPVPGRFDLIVIIDILGSFWQPGQVRRACQKVVSALIGGGHVLYGDFLGDVNRRRIHNSWWGRHFLRGAPNIIQEFRAQGLIEVACRETSMHLIALLRN